MSAILACGVCAAGIGRAIFPPVLWWALIATLWFVALAVVRARFDLPSWVIPRPLGAVVIVLLITWIGSVGAGPFFHLLLLVPCTISTTHKLLARSNTLPRERRAILVVLSVVVACLGVATGAEYFHVSRMTPAERVERL